MFRSGFTYSFLRRCCPSQVATLSVRRVSPYQVSVSNNQNIQVKPCTCRGVAECGDPPRLNAHQSQSFTSVPTGVQSGSDLSQNAFHKTSSVCSWFDSPNVLFTSKHSCRFHQFESYVSYVRHLVALQWLGLPLHPA